MSGSFLLLLLSAALFSTPAFAMDEGVVTAVNPQFGPYTPNIAVSWRTGARTNSRPSDLHVISGGGLKEGAVVKRINSTGKVDGKAFAKWAALEKSGGVKSDSEGMGGMTISRGPFPSSTYSSGSPSRGSGSSVGMLSQERRREERTSTEEKLFELLDNDQIRHMIREVAGGATVSSAFSRAQK